MNKHTRHHGNPNVIGRDPDIDEGHDLLPRRGCRREPRSPPADHAEAGLPVLPAADCSRASTCTCTASARVRQAHGQAPRLESRRSSPFASSASCAGVLGFLPLAGRSCSSSCSSRCSACTWAPRSRPNHKGMPLIPRDEQVDFLDRQVLTSRNIRGGKSWTRSWAASTTRSSTTCSRAWRARAGAHPADRARVLPRERRALHRDRAHRVVRDRHRVPQPGRARRTRPLRLPR